MKKLLTTLLTTVLAVQVLTACGAQEDTNTTPTPAPTDSVNTAPIEGEDAVAGTDANRIVLKDYPVEDYVTLGDYKNMTVILAGTEVAQSDWDTLNAQVYNEMVTLENGGMTDRAVAEGDIINLDYSGKKDGVVFDGGTAASQQLEIGSDSFIDGFEDGLIGVMPGETVDLNLTFPANYDNVELAGQAVVFTVTVNFIYPTEEYWSDEVIAAAGNENFNSIETMKQYVYDYIKDYNEYYYDINLENEVVKTFIEECQFKEIPADLVESYRNDFILTMTNEAANYGMDVNSLCNYYYGMDLQSFLSIYVEESVKQSMAFQAVANAENMNLSDEAFDARLQELADSYGYTGIEEYIGNNPKEGYRELFMLEDVVAFLVENTTVNNPE